MFSLSLLRVKDRLANTGRDRKCRRGLGGILPPFHPCGQFLGTGAHSDLQLGLCPCWAKRVFWQGPAPHSMHVSDSTECLLSFLLHLETGHPSSPSAGTPARRPELPLAPFPRAVPGMLLGCALGAPSLQLMPDSSRCCSRGVDLIAGSLLRNTGRRGNAMVLSWWLPLVQVQNMMQGQDPVRCGPPPHASASRFCRLLHSAPEAVALRRDPAHASPCQHGGPA